MKRTISALMAAAALVIFTTGLSAQGKPSFVGKWTLQADPAAAPPAGGGGGRAGGGGGRMGGMGGGLGFACGTECTIAQDATTLTVTRTTPAGETKAAFKLDGTESTNSMTMGETTMTSKSKAVWEGAKLVITTTADMGGQAIETKATLSLDASGNLVVERAGGRGAQPTQTYKKG
jgi:hypothetical protein